MLEIAVHDVKEGQVLAEDVTCPETGQVLLAAGAEIKGSHVELLERRGVLTVRIVDDGGSGGATEERAAEETPAHDEFVEAVSRLEHMFEGLDDDPIMRALHSVARGMVESAKKAGGTDEGGGQEKGKGVE